MNYDYKIKISNDRYLGYLKAELLHQTSFLGFSYWESVYIFKDKSHIIASLVNQWSDYYKIPTENIIHLNK